MKRLTVFLSASSPHFSDRRKKLNELLSSNYIAILEQSQFSGFLQPTLCELYDMIDEHADALIHIVGADPGSLVPMKEVDELFLKDPFIESFPPISNWVEAGLPSVDGNCSPFSYTQWELYIAARLKKEYMIYYEADPGYISNDSQLHHMEAVKTNYSRFGIPFTNLEELTSHIKDDLFGLGSPETKSLSAETAIRRHCDKLLSEGAESFNLFDRSTYIPRQSEESLSHYIKDNLSKICIVEGTSGAGKSTMVYRWLESIANETVATLFRCRDDMDGNITKLLSTQLDDSNNKLKDSLSSIRDLARFRHKNGYKPVILIFDAINESKKGLSLFASIVHWLEEIPENSVKIVITTTSVFADQNIYDEDKNPALRIALKSQMLYKGGEDRVILYEFSESEAKKAYERYQNVGQAPTNSWEGLPILVRQQLQNPWFMRVFLDVYKGEFIEGNQSIDRCIPLFVHSRLSSVSSVYEAAKKLSPNLDAPLITFASQIVKSASDEGLSVDESIIDDHTGIKHYIEVGLINSIKINDNQYQLRFTHDKLADYYIYRYLKTLGLHTASEVSEFVNPHIGAKQLYNGEVLLICDIFTSKKESHARCEFLLNILESIDQFPFEEVIIGIICRFEENDLRQDLAHIYADSRIRKAIQPYFGEALRSLSFFNINLLYRIVQGLENIDEWDEAESLYELGNAALEKSDYQIAERCFEKIIRTSTDPELRIRAIGMKAHVFRVSSKIKEAKASIREGLNLVKTESPDSTFAWQLLYEDGFLLRCEGEYQKAKGVYHKMIAMVERDNKRIVDLVRSKHQLGLTYFDEGINLQRAEEFALEAKEMASSTGITLWIHNSNQLLGRIYLAQGRYELAEKVLSDALNYYRFDLADPNGIGATLMWLVEAQVARIRIGEHLGESEKLLTDINHREMLSYLFILRKEIVDLVGAERNEEFLAKARENLQKFPNAYCLRRFEQGSHIEQKKSIFGWFGRRLKPRNPKLKN